MKRALPTLPLSEASMAGDWSEEQNEAIVADYLTMPGAEWQL
ncbi:hypothetical protein X743_11510 [Mesorhizobium sp. LNHC252B00]|nr:hypothetical protein X743_11510 [Mesorhizobium sp. LNHC252B00]